MLRPAQILGVALPIGHGAASEILASPGRFHAERVKR